MRKITLFLCTLFLTTCSQPDFSHIRVIEVIDGDTIRLEGNYLLRYIGIDTPELKKFRRGRWHLEPQPFAEEAFQFNRKLVEKKNVRIEFDVERKDKYGRLLGYVFVGDKLINAELIRQGFAVVYTYPPNLKYVDLFLKLQREARQNKRGLWGVYEVITPQETSQFIGEIRTVRGKVLNTYKSEKCIFLNFGKDWHKDFTVVIFKHSWGEFLRQGIKPETFYKGKIVEVSGRIREYNGPEIIVGFPGEIRVVKEE